MKNEVISIKIISFKNSQEFLVCVLTAVSDDTLTLDIKGATWDNRQIITVFEHNQ